MLTIQQSLQRIANTIGETLNTNSFDNRCRIHNLYYIAQRLHPESILQLEQKQFIAGPRSAVLASRLFQLPPTVPQPTSKILEPTAITAFAKLSTHAQKFVNHAIAIHENNPTTKWHRIIWMTECRNTYSNAETHLAAKTWLHQHYNVPTYQEETTKPIQFLGKVFNKLFRRE